MADRHRTLPVSIAAVALLTLSGCTPAGSGIESSAPSAAGPEPTGPPPAPTLGLPTATSAAAAPEIQAEVEIPAADGLVLKGTFTPGQGGDGAAVVLLHMYGSDRSSWAEFANVIASSGISSLTIDLRGHGQTDGVEDWEQAKSDVQVAFDWLRGRPGVNPDRVGIAGASIGANLSLVQAADDPEAVAGVALLSPGLDYFRVQIEGLAGRIGDMPLFLAAAENDGYSAETVRILAEESGGEPALEVYDGSAHGTDLFSTHPELAEKLLRFFEEALGG